MPKAKNPRLAFPFPREKLIMATTFHGSGKKGKPVTEKMLLIQINIIQFFFAFPPIALEFWWGHLCLTNYS